MSILFGVNETSGTFEAKCKYIPRVPVIFLLRIHILDGLIANEKKTAH